VVPQPYAAAAAAVDRVAGASEEAGGAYSGVKRERQAMEIAVPDSFKEEKGGAGGGQKKKRK